MTRVAGHNGTSSTEPAQPPERRAGEQPISGTEHGPRARRTPRPDAPPPSWDERRLTPTQRRLLSWQRRLGSHGAIVVMTSVLSVLSTVVVCSVIAVIYGPREMLTWQYPVFSFFTPALLVPLSFYQVMKLLETFVQLSDDYRELAVVDQLTGALNRRGLFEQAAELTADSQVAMADLDDFKAVNDRYGHDFGDRVLIAAARRLTGVAGDGAVVARTGGDEFVLLLPDARQLPSGADLEVDAVPVRISIGVAPYRPGAGVDSALLAADDALYAVKARTTARTRQPVPAEDSAG